MSELAEILSALESDQVPIDELEAKVERASELLDYCEKKLKNTELRVKKIIERLD